MRQNHVTFVTSSFVNFRWCCCYCWRSRLLINSTIDLSVKAATLPLFILMNIIKVQKRNKKEFSNATNNLINKIQSYKCLCFFHPLHTIFCSPNKWEYHRVLRSLRSRICDYFHSTHGTGRANERTNGIVQNVPLYTNDAAKTLTASVLRRQLNETGSVWQSLRHVNHFNTQRHKPRIHTQRLLFSSSLSLSMLLLLCVTVVYSCCCA